MQPNIRRIEVPAVVPQGPDPTLRPAHTLHGLLLEGSRSLALVQVGLGSLDFIAPWRRLGLRAPGLVTATTPPPLRQQLTCAGYCADDVTDVFLSHLHETHTGGLHDFPRARVHGLPSALGTDPSSIARLLPDPTRWVSPATPREPMIGLETYPVVFEDSCVHLVELPGPYPGHAGWLVPRGSDWLLHVGALIDDADELAFGPTTPHQAMRLLTDDKPFSRLQSLQLVKRLNEREGSRVLVLASFIAPASLGVSLPLLSRAEAPYG